MKNILNIALFNIISTISHPVAEDNSKYINWWTKFMFNCLFNMKRILLPILVILYSCKSSIETNIHSIENGLLRATHEEDSSIEKYNLIDRMDYYNVPGLALAIIDGSQLEWSKGYGHTTFDKTSLVNENTLFQIGSAGKMITSLTTLALVEKGVLDLEKDVNEYLTSWEIPKNPFVKDTPITLKMLLSHTAGIQDDYSEQFVHNKYLPGLTEHLNINDYQIIRDPGEDYFYTGAGYIIIEQIIEDVTGKPYKTVAEEEVLLPLNMNNTYLQIFLADSLLDNVAYAHHKNGEIYKNNYPIYPCFAPGTSNWSNATDMAKLLIEVGDAYLGKTNKILSQQMTEYMLTNFSPAYGLGMKVIEENGGILFGHSGDFYGYHAGVYGILKEGKGIIVLTNGDHGVKLYNEVIRSVANFYDWSNESLKSMKIESDTNTEFDSIVGTYYLPGKLDIINVYNDGGRLYCDIFGATNSELIQASPFKYYNERTDGFLTFSKDINGAVNNMTFSRIGVLLPGIRLDGFDNLYNDNFMNGIEAILNKSNYYINKPYFEGIFNNIGYVLLEKNKYTNSIEVFKLGTELYPYSANLFDSLGEAYLENGQYDLAIKYYNRSLELNPNNSNAKDVLKVLNQ